MPNQTSGGVPLTRARLDRALAGTPVTSQYAERNRPWCWSVQHHFELRRQWHPYNQMSSQEFYRLCVPGLLEAGAALAEAGYHVYYGPLLTAEELAALPEHMRESAHDSNQGLLLVPDDIPGGRPR